MEISVRHPLLSRSVATQFPRCRFFQLVNSVSFRRRACDFRRHRIARRLRAFSARPRAARRPRFCISVYFYARVIAPTVYFCPAAIEKCNVPRGSDEDAASWDFHGVTGVHAGVSLMSSPIVKRTNVRNIQRVLPFPWNPRRSSFWGSGLVSRDYRNYRRC